MIYAELVTDRIEDRGVFHSLSEFLPYRAKGWTSTEANNALADERLEKLRNTSETVLRYCAPMLRFGEDYRFELHRRTGNDSVIKERE